MENNKLISLLERSLESLDGSVDCADPSCQCEGNDTSKDLARDLLAAIEALKEGKKPCVCGDPESHEFTLSCVPF